MCNICYKQDDHLSPYCTLTLRDQYRDLHDYEELEEEQHSRVHVESYERTKRDFENQKPIEGTKEKSLDPSPQRPSEDTDFFTTGTWREFVHKRTRDAKETKNNQRERSGTQWGYFKEDVAKKYTTTGNFRDDDVEEQLQSHGRYRYDTGKYTPKIGRTEYGGGT